MKTSVDRSACPKCHGSGMSFTTQQMQDGFTVSWTPCDCKAAISIPLTSDYTPSPVFL